MTQLEHAFKIGCTDDQACVYAGISNGQLEYYMNKVNPEFRATKELWKELPIIQSRQTVVDALKTDPGTAFRYLERKQKDEFAPVRELGSLFDPDVGSVQVTIVRSKDEAKSEHQGNSSSGQESTGEKETGS